MIGGTDVIIPTMGGASALDACLRIVRQVWPQAVYENALTGEKTDRFEQLPQGSVSEVFVYRDQDAAQAWEENGAIPALANTMLHFLLSPTAVTVVVDDTEDQVMSQVLHALRLTLQRETFKAAG